MDIVVAIPSQGQVLLHWQCDPEHPDYEICRQVRVIDASHDAVGKPWEIIELPAPQTVCDEGGWVDYSYINHLVINGAVIACEFDDLHDGPAREVLPGCYPGREIVTVDARQIFARGGGIHCITQQQPQAGSRAAPTLGHARVHERGLSCG